MSVKVLPGTKPSFWPTVMALAAVLIVPALLALCWISEFGRILAAVRGWTPPLAWEIWPLAIFPMRLLFANQLMKQDERPAYHAPARQYPCFPKLSNQEFWKEVESGRIKLIS